MDYDKIYEEAFNDEVEKIAGLRNEQKLKKKKMRVDTNAEMNQGYANARFEHPDAAAKYTRNTLIGGALGLGASIPLFNKATKIGELTHIPRDMPISGNPNADLAKLLLAAAIGAPIAGLLAGGRVGGIGDPETKTLLSKFKGVDEKYKNNLNDIKKAKLQFKLDRI